jgi:8-oxo-dGTP pyrophosphatase MutT (NUDIX family)
MNASTFPLDVDLLRRRLDGLPGRDGDPSPQPGGWLAAVALVLRPAGSRTELLMIKRASHERDPWSGHMAFPGGRRETVDASLLHTAIRETREEVGIDLEGDGEPLGRLGVMAPVSPSLPPVTIVPFVFRVEPETTARVASREVAEYHWVPLRHLGDPENRITHHFTHEGLRRAFPAIDVEGRTVWGLTHRILADFLERVGE